MDTPEDNIRLLIADDHNLFRSGLVNLLLPENGIFIVGEAGNGEELVEKYFSISPPPDVIIVDISMPVLSGLEAAKRILAADKSAKILFLSMYDDDEYIYHCIKVGGKGLVNKNVLKGELILAIKQIHQGKEYYKNGITKEYLEKLYANQTLPDFDKILLYKNKLSVREEEVLTLIGKGLTSNEIADKLKIRKRTIDGYRANIIQKLNLKNLPELIKYAIFHNIKP
jgi:DNA-binding NarL/FixJ family response regulator